MKATELIAKLQELVEKHGDKNVVLDESTTVSPVAGMWDDLDRFVLTADVTLIASIQKNSPWLMP